MGLSRPLAEQDSDHPVNETQQASNKLATAFEMGQSGVDLTDVMIASQKASVSFQAMTQALPGLRPWTDPERSEPTSKVFGMGDLICRWRDMVAEGEPIYLENVAHPANSRLALAKARELGWIV